MTEEQKKYPVLCAWCEKEGERTILGLSTVEHSHGICPRHADELKEQARQYAAAICKDMEENSREEAQKTQERRQGDGEGKHKNRRDIAVVDAPVPC